MVTLFKRAVLLEIETCDNEPIIKKTITEEELLKFRIRI